MEQECDQLPNWHVIITNCHVIITNWHVIITNCHVIIMLLCLHVLYQHQHTWVRSLSHASSTTTHGSGVSPHASSTTTHGSGVSLMPHPPPHMGQESLSCLIHHHTWVRSLSHASSTTTHGSGVSLMPHRRKVSLLLLTPCSTHGFTRLSPAPLIAVDR